MPEFVRDHGARFFVERALVGGQGSASGPAGERGLEAGDFFEAPLRVGMPEAVRVPDAPFPMVRSPMSS